MSGKGMFGAMEIAERARQYVDFVQKRHPGWTTTKISGEAGYESSEFLDGLLSGQVYYSWMELDEFCVRAEINGEWLKHGEGAPFLPSDKYLTGIEPLIGMLKKLDTSEDWKLICIRSDCDHGRFCVVLQRGELKWRTFHTNIHVSNRNGYGGSLMVLGLYRFLVAVKEDWITREMGYTLPICEFETLTSGKVFPATLLEGKRTDFWTDDFIRLECRNDYDRAQIAAHGKEFRDAQFIVRFMLEEEAIAAA